MIDTNNKNLSNCTRCRKPGYYVREYSKVDKDGYYPLRCRHVVGYGIFKDATTKQIIRKSKIIKSCYIGKAIGLTQAVENSLRQQQLQRQQQQLQNQKEFK
jgi:hypothetical protein